MERKGMESKRKQNKSLSHPGSLKQVLLYYNLTLAPKYLDIFGKFVFSVFSNKPQMGNIIYSSIKRDSDSTRTAGLVWPGWAVIWSQKVDFLGFTHAPLCPIPQEVLEVGVLPGVAVTESPSGASRAYLGLRWVIWVFFLSVQQFNC